VIFAPEQISYIGYNLTIFRKLVLYLKILSLAIIHQENLAYFCFLKNHLYRRNMQLHLSSVIHFTVLNPLQEIIDTPLP
jgi:hypothetical protein